MDLARFLGILEDSALTFPRADMMVDRWEGGLGTTTKAMGFTGQMVTVDTSTISREMRQAGRLSTYLSCWHLSEYESAAMWDVYQRDGRGVAIMTSWQDLTGSIVDHRAIYGSKVRYVDYRIKPPPFLNITTPLLYKRKSFRHEHEARLFSSLAAEGPYDTLPDVLKVAVDLQRLIHHVLVAPGQPTWVVEVVQSVFRRFGYDPARVSQSPLFDGPAT